MLMHIGKYFYSAILVGAILASSYNIWEYKARAS